MFNDFHKIIVLTHWPHASDFKIAIFNLVSLIGISGSAYDNTFRWMPQDEDDKSLLVQVMAWCCQATRHYLKLCWPKLYCHHITWLGHHRLINVDEKGVFKNNLYITAHLFFNGTLVKLLAFSKHTLLMLITCNRESDKTCSTLYVEKFSRSNWHT